MLTREIEILEQLADACAKGQLQLDYPERVAAERALFNSAHILAREFADIDLTGFSMAARAALDQAIVSDNVTPLAQSALRTAFELAAAFGALTSVNPYRQKDVAGSIGGTSRDAIVLFGRRVSAYCALLKSNELYSAGEP